MARDASVGRLRELRPGEIQAATSLAMRAFHENRFYERALGVRPTDLPVYWDALFRLLLASGDARVYALDRAGRLAGLMLTVLDGFGRPLEVVPFLARLVVRLGPLRFLRYLRFVRAYDRALDALGHPSGTEGRCLWLMVDPLAGARLGSTLVREVRIALHREGRSVGTGLIDAGDPRIVRFYRGLGFRISEPFPFRGGSASTIEIATSPAGICPAWHVVLHERIREIDPARWDGVPGDPLSAHAVLAALETAHLPDMKLRALTLEDAAGRWVAAAPVAILRVDGAALTRGIFQAFIRTVRRVRPNFMRTKLLICGTPLSVGNAPMRMVPDALASRVYRELGRALERMAAEERVPWTAFKEIPEGGLAAAGSLGRRGWTVAPSEPNMVLSLRWPTYDAYVESLRSHYRYKIRRSERAREAAGIRRDVVPLAEGYDAAAHALYESVLGRARVRLEHLTPEFLRALGRALPDSTHMLRFWKEGRLVGWVALLTSGETAFDLFHGIDYRVCGSSALYFDEIARTIRHAIECGARELVLGQSSETAKSRFGGAPAPLWIAVRHRSPWVRLLLRTAGRGLFPERPLLPRRVFSQRLGSGAAVP